MHTENLNTNDFNTVFVLRDSTGRIKPLWQENTLGRKFRLKGISIPRVPFLLGRWRPQMEHHNLITNVGHAAANGRISNQGGFGAFVNIAIGQSTAAATATDMALGYEITSGGGIRAAATASQVTTTVTNDTTQLVKTFTFSASFAITEAGVVDSASVPTVTTLSAAISTTGATSISVVSGTGIGNGDYLQIDNEILQVSSGGGTTALTVTRGQKGSTAATHASGIGVVDISTAANLLAKQSFSVLNVVGGDQLQLTWRISS